MVSCGELSQSEEYSSFRSSVPLRVIVVDSYPSEGWKVYDVGPKSVKTPLICLPPVSGTADIFYRQLMGLSAKGYRVISAEHPPYWSAKEWCEGFRKLMDHLGLVKVHIFGASLGGFLAQKYAEYTCQCQRVASLFLCNTYMNTSVFRMSDTGSFYRTYPSMFLKRMILGNFPTKLMEKEISDSVDFMVEKVRLVVKILTAKINPLATFAAFIRAFETKAATLVSTAVIEGSTFLVAHPLVASLIFVSAIAALIALENLSRKDLCSRLSIIHVSDCVDVSKITGIPVTISDVFDDYALSPTDRDAMYRYYPQAKLAHLKTGGNFPYLSRSDEINMHLQIHLRPFLETPLSARE